MPEAAEHLLKQPKHARHAPKLQEGVSHLLKSPGGFRCLPKPSKASRCPCKAARSFWKLLDTFQSCRTSCSASFGCFWQILAALEHVQHLFAASKGVKQLLAASGALKGIWRLPAAADGFKRHLAAAQWHQKASWSVSDNFWLHVWQLLAVW